MKKWKVDGFTCTKSAQMGIIFALFFFFDRVYFSSSIWANQRGTLVTEGFGVRSSSTDLSPKGSQQQVNQPLYQQNRPRIESRFSAFLLCSSFVFPCRGSGDYLICTYQPAAQYRKSHHPRNTHLISLGILHADLGRQDAAQEYLPSDRLHGDKYKSADMR